MTSARQTLYLHIGTHKTGSTSLQYYLGSIRSLLATQGFVYFTGEYEPNNHVELFAVSIRLEREAFSKSKYRISGSPEAIASVTDAFRAFRERNEDKTLIASTEGLSLLRHDDEIEILKSILGAETLDIIPILILRDKTDFLESFRKQILKHVDRELSSDPASINYVEADSWLADYDAIVGLWGRHFGRENLHILDYDRIMRSDCDILPAVLRTMQIPDDLIPEAGSVRMNTDSWKIRVKRLLRILGIRL